MIPNSALQKILEEFNTLGELSFYKKVLFASLKEVVLLKSDKEYTSTPHLSLLALHDTLISKYRADDKEQYLIMARIYRKVAHKIYWIMLKERLSNINYKFLNRV
jgi:hypothetical protein